ncbi:hypothetical protein B0F89_10169 [Malaciobacter marinus]|uniref:ApeA N-terminal domain-containing protein n=2 Tax=Malaciobacter marinus TaxID=505249 RepID=A0AB37A012_9BACT|nr:hypothetical protein B0F89_10169 [Malaciobacter marinus]
MDFFQKTFNDVGWFIPPYVRIGYLIDIIKDVNLNEHNNLEELLSHIYNADGLSAMVVHRYPFVPIISEYSQIISESIKAHFLGLHHIAVSGLIPVVEGVARKIAESKGIQEEYIKPIFIKLSEHTKDDVEKNQLGMVSEIIPMLESFKNFATNNLYIKSQKYSLEDKTNRHGILHGEYSDGDYGKPINFYKVIGFIDFLCFIISIRESISFFAPDITVKSQQLSRIYKKLETLAKT